MIPVSAMLTRYDPCCDLTSSEVGWYVGDSGCRRRKEGRQRAHIDYLLLSGACMPGVKAGLGWRCEGESRGNRLLPA
jgi:hypothetical protein